MLELCVYVVESDDKQREEMIKELENGRFIRVVGEESDGERAYKEIALLKPDVVITGLVLPTMDGFALIEKLKRLLPKTDIIVASALSGKGFISRAMDLGASYYMMHPINPQSLIETVAKTKSDNSGNFKLMQNDISAKSIEEKISNIFISIGIPAHIKGYQFLREAIKLAIEKPDIINSITKALYPAIANSYNTSASKVERAIRHAIEVAWNKGRIENINNLFGVKIYTANDKPTNGEFIALIADKMLIENM
ncbi:MAG: sporulation transcription factor Spo0A [Clostridia bacterium]|nr:sporulation transcription factor Spo0A [Clostridia bacterium]